MRLVLRCLRAALILVVALGTVAALGGAVAAEAQRRGGARGGRGFVSVPTNVPYDARFQFCRVAFDSARQGDGGGWSVDFPRADLNFPYRLGQLTSMSISRDARNEPNHRVFRLTDPEMFTCPIIMMTEVGAAAFTDEEAESLRAYLLKGGFLWADDFWGDYAWQFWQRAIARVLPAEQYPIFDVPLDHPIFHTFFDVKKIPQIPSINSWFATGSTSERFDSQVPHFRAIADDDGRIMVVMSHNTDFGDAFEREGENREFFDRFALDGYAVGTDVVIYALTH